MLSQRDELILESMEEATSLYIQFIEEKFANDAVRQAEEYRNMLPGSWGFPAEFSLWRDRCSSLTRTPSGSQDGQSCSSDV